MGVQEKTEFKAFSYLFFLFILWICIFANLVCSVSELVGKRDQ